MVEALSQRLNGNQRSMFASTCPVVTQLRFTLSRPLGHEASRAGWQATCENRKILEIEDRLCLAISSMEMGTTSMLVLVVIHPDRDPVEAAYLRHPWIVRLLLSQNKTDA